MRFLSVSQLKMQWPSIFRARKNITRIVLPWMNTTFSLQKTVLYTRQNKIGLKLHVLFLSALAGLRYYLLIPPVVSLLTQLHHRLLAAVPGGTYNS